MAFRSRWSDVRQVVGGATLAALALSGCATARVAGPQPGAPAVVSARSAEPAATEAAEVGKPPKKTPHGEAYTARDLGFELDKPAGEAWALATNVTSPEGRPIPVVVAHPESGAQIVVQVSDPVDSPQKLATMLRDKLQAEKTLDLGDAKKLAVDSGSDAYGFDFKVKGEANGRVAVITVGEHIVLLVASWPENADAGIVNEIDGVVKSVREPSGANHAMMRPDKA